MPMSECQNRGLPPLKALQRLVFAFAVPVVAAVAMASPARAELAHDRAHCSHRTAVQCHRRDDGAVPTGMAMQIAASVAKRFNMSESAPLVVEISSR